MDCYFNQVVRDIITELKKKGSSYCFSLEQLEEVQKYFKTPISYSLKDGIYYLNLKKKGA